MSMVPSLICCACSSQHVIGENVDLDLATGAGFDPRRKLLGCRVRRMILLREMRPTQGQRGSIECHERRRQSQCCATGAGLEKHPAVHGVLPLTLSA